MPANDDPEDRIRELERPLADAARASELGGAPPPSGGYPPAPPPPPAPWTYGAAFPGYPQQRRSGNRMWWILGTVVVVGMAALAAGIAVFAGRHLSGVRSIINSPPSISATFGPPTSAPGSRSPSSDVPPQGDELTVTGVNERRTIACNDSVVHVTGASNTVVIAGHCASLSVAGLQNEITVDAVDSIEASGLNNKVTYHSGAPKITNSGVSNVIQRG